MPWVHHLHIVAAGHNRGGLGTLLDWLGLGLGHGKPLERGVTMGTVVGAKSKNGD